jgi:hypothetical protein
MAAVDDGIDNVAEFSGRGVVNFAEDGDDDHWTAVAHTNLEDLRRFEMSVPGHVGSSRRRYVLEGPAAAQPVLGPSEVRPEHSKGRGEIPDRDESRPHTIDSEECDTRSIPPRIRLERRTGPPKPSL